MASAKVARGSLRWIMSFKNFANLVADTEIGAVHVAGDYKNATDGQVMVRNVCEPESFTLGMKTTKEGEDRCASPFRSTEELAHAIGILGINAPVSSEKGCKTCGMGKRG